MLTGHSSDGDSRRRNLMLTYRGEEGLPTANFTITSDGSNLTDQDYVHNIKKLANPLDHASKDLRIGKSETIGTISTCYCYH